MRRRKATPLLAEALSILIWKIRPPSGYPADANILAKYFIAELEDKGIVGLSWVQDRFISKEAV